MFKRIVVAVAATAALAAGLVALPVADPPGGPTVAVERVGTAPDGLPIFEVEVDGDTPAAVAQAGPACSIAFFCGWINVVGSYGIRVTYSWGDIYATDRFVYPGHNSNEYGRDTDGFRVAPNTDIRCYAGAWYTWFRTDGWYKITDLNQWNCRVYST